MEMTDSNDELFTNVMTSLVRGGVIRRNDCGSRINISDCRLVMPIACAASVWPASIDCKPARTISAMKPPALKARATTPPQNADNRSEEHTSELQSHSDLVCRLLLEKKKKKIST